MRKLLLLTYHFPPSGASGAFRMLGLARHLPRFGWQPVVVAPATLPWEPVDEGLERQIPEDLPVVRVPYPQGWFIKPARRLSQFGIWLPPALAACRRLIRRERPDAVLTSSPPPEINLLGLWLKRWLALPWVADFRDPWVTQGKRLSPWAPSTWVATRLERAVIQAADRIVANTPFATTGLRSAFPDCRNKITTVNNGFDPESFAGVERPSSSPVWHILHAGEVYAGRDPRPFLDALGGVSREGVPGGKGLRVSFLGRAMEGDFDALSEIRQRGLEGIVELGGHVSYQESLRDMARSDLLLLLDTPGRRFGAPAKLYEYFGAGRAVLALAEPDGDVAWLLRQSGILHRLAPPGDAARIAAALRSLLQELADGRKPVQRPEHLLAFTRESMAENMARVLDASLGLKQARTSAPAPQFAESATAS
jgi:glycosyltransferase involved in cell wall biosynthesis